MPELPSQQELQQRLDGWRERYLVAGATVAVMLGEEVRASASGVLNLNTGVETTADSLFQIGSITKVYTTSMVMQLVDEGRLELDAPVRGHLPGLRFGDDATAAAVTPRHLLTHTSGVDGDFFDDFGRGDDGVANYVDACRRLPSIAPLGETWTYCNAGFVVLGRVIEVLDGRTWDESLRERIIRPLGLAHTLTLPEDALLHRAAAGHYVGLDRSPQLTARWSMARSAGPAGATPCATAGDLLGFARMHIDGGASPLGGRLLSEGSVREMQRVQFDLPPQPGDAPARWGLGWALFDWGGTRVIGHDGGTLGQASSLRVFPEQRFAVAVVTNTSPTGGLLASRIMRWLFGAVAGIEMPPYPRPHETPVALDLSPYAGTYEHFAQRTEVTIEDGRLVARMTNTSALAELAPPQPPMALFAVDESVFLQQFGDTQVYNPMSFLKFEDGRPRYLFSGGRLSRRR